jgi:hypothetical protein
MAKSSQKVNLSISGDENTLVSSVFDCISMQSHKSKPKHGQSLESKPHRTLLQTSL